MRFSKLNFIKRKIYSLMKTIENQAQNMEKFNY